MMVTAKRVGSMLLVVLLFLGALSIVGPVSAATTTGLTVTYTFTGDEAAKAGFAQGEITIVPGTDSRTEGYYLIYYADDTDTLKAYDELATVAITGSAVLHTVKDGTMIPSEATRIAVFENDTRILDETPSISRASAVVSIPASKRLTPGTPQLTFATTSDVHMDYQSYSRGAYEKWAAALDFFAQERVDYVIVTGDMTGDDSLDEQYQQYVNIIGASDVPIDNVYEAIGNHGNTPSTIGLFTEYTSGKGEVHAYENSPYYSVFLEGKTETARDTLFIFMAQELQAPGDSAAYDNFSQAQIDWLEGLLTQYGNTDTNIFLIEHSPFLNFGAGDRHNGGYTALVTFKEEYTQTMRLKALLETYKDVIVMSGHTHLSLYDTENYSDEYNSFARMVHVGSTCFPTAYGEGFVYTRGTDGRYTVTETYGSEAYIVDVYDEYIVYTGYNLTTGKIIPGACLLLPTEAYGGAGRPVGDEVLAPEDAFEGSGTASDPYLIQNADDFKALTNGFNASTSTTQTEMYGYGLYFQQTTDIDMSGVSGYAGTTANGDAKCFFAGTYNGGGYSITVNIREDGQRSVFPYVYGTLYNVVIRGSIVSGESAQPVRTLYGSLVHCEFDMTLSANRAHGLVYSNYGSIYNVYTHGTVTANYPDAAAASNSSTTFVQVYHNYVSETGEEITDTYGTRSNDAATIAAVWNDRSSQASQEAQALIGDGEPVAVSAQAGVLVFAHSDTPYRTLYHRQAQQNGGGSYTYANGVLTMKAASESGYSVTFDTDTVFDPNDMVYLLLDVSSTVDYTISMSLTLNGSEAVMEMRREFFNHFGYEELPEALPAGTYTKTLNMYGYYEWQKALSESTISSVTITLTGTGKLTLYALQLSRNTGVVRLYDAQLSDGTTLLTSSVHAVGTATVFSAEENMTAEKFAVGFDQEAVTVFDAEGVALSGTATVGSGMTVASSVSGAVSYTVAIKGDVDGDGRVSTVDARRILSAILSSGDMPDWWELAANYNGADTVNTSDVRAILSHVVAK